MNKKLFLLALCLMMSISVLFAGQPEFEPAHNTPAHITPAHSTDDAATDLDPSVQADPPQSTLFFRAETLMYDNGIFDNALGLQGGPSTPDSTEQYGFATHFILSDFGITTPRTAETILMQFGILNGTDYRIFIWDNIGPGLRPNSHATHLYADFSVPQPAPDVWQEIDVSAAGVTLPDTFWIGYILNELVTPADWYVALNTGLTDDHTYGNLNGTSTGWAEMGSYGWGYAYACRVVVEAMAADTHYWEILPNMPYTTSGPYVGYHVDSLGNTFVHSFGGNPGPQANHYIYDYANGTYAAGTPLPTASTYGGTVSFNNMIYMCAAWTGATNVITIYDCINDTYTTRSLPGGGRANPAVVSKDNRYVYVVGGYPGWQGGTAVDVYDAIADTFFSNPTQLPANCASAHAAGALIAGDTILVAAGYDGAGSATNRVVYGVIDPVDPGTITWGIHGTTYPAGATYRLGGSDWDGIGYFTGGNQGGSYITNTYSYEAGVGWVTLPVKPTGCMNLGWVMAPVDTQYTDDAEVLGFAMGGYSPYMDIGEAYHTATIVTGIVEKPNEGVGQFSCKLISSNPSSSGNALIQLVMPAEGPVKFSVYDVTGRKILSREFTRIHAGTHTIRWERKNDQGTSVSAGNYFYRVEAAGNVTTGKLVILN